MCTDGLSIGRESSMQRMRDSRCKLKVGDLQEKKQ